MAAKKTSELIPLCHPIALTKVEVDIAAEGNTLVVTATAETTRPHRRRDGSHDGGLGRRADPLRHGQGHRSRHARHRRSSSMEKSGGKSGDYRR